MKTINKKSMFQSIMGLSIVIGVIFFSFFYKNEIEEYALTGYFGVFVACLSATSTILLPAPGIVVVIQYAQFLNPVIVILLGSLGTALGEMIGYILGRSGNEIANINTDSKFFYWMKKRPFILVFIFSVIPLPLFDVIGISAGMMKVNPLKFWISCFGGKLFKMIMYVVAVQYAKEIILNM